MENKELEKKIAELQEEQNELWRIGNDGHAHESDGLIYLSSPVQYKCKKCGQFYK